MNDYTYTKYGLSYHADWQSNPHFHYSGDSRRDRIVGDDTDNLIQGKNGNDHLIGGAGNDELNGGAGRDVLTGGAGADAFIFDSKLGRNNVDRITDFNSKEGDVIALSSHIFKGLPSESTGGFTQLKPSHPDVFRAALEKHFRVGDKALDADDHIIYNQASGALYYDSDGNGAGAAVKFAQLKPGTALHYWDLIVL
ncbi:calcium-binding protein [Microvirga alba]|uniref:Calcium-binding protein n=1 Tax=Microvirga alba TaxID=2791025 RepID=A0A931BTM9_9HYPH|nr:calcium-binding protein [Microvirga alba]MBF9234975.1 calcium-binding protein [Microvirga alba]